MSAAMAGKRSPQVGVAAAADQPFTQQVQLRFGRGARHYDQEALLQQAMAWRLGHLCADLPLPEGPCADLGAGTGLLSRALQRHHRQLDQQPPLQLDLCPELLARNPLAGVSDPLARGDAHHAARCGARWDDPASDNDEGSHTGRPNGMVWDLNDGLPAQLNNAALLASSFALQWLEHPATRLSQWCHQLRPGGWLVLAVPTDGSFPQWRHAAARAGVPCTALALPDAEVLRQAASSSGLSLRRAQRLQFSRPRQGGLRTLRHLQRLGAGASRRRPLTPGQLRRLLAHWPATSPLTWEVLLLIGQRPAA